MSFNLSNVGEIFWVNSERTVSKVRKRKFCVLLTYSLKRACEIRKFHVAVVQQRLRNVQKKRDARAKLFFVFVSLNLLFFCRSPSPLQKLSVVVIQKFCYYGNVTSHFSYHFLDYCFFQESVSRNLSKLKPWELPPNRVKHKVTAQNRERRINNTVNT